MVSATEIRGDKPNSKANWKNKQKPGSQVPRFRDTATSDNVLHGEVITTGANQDGQVVTLVKALPSYIGANQDADWAESFCSMNWKIQVDFMTTEPRKRYYGAVDALGAFQ